MDDKKFQIDVLTRLTAIETLLKEQDYKSINERLSNTENTSKNKISSIQNSLIRKNIKQDHGDFYRIENQKQNYRSPYRTDYILFYISHFSHLST